MMQYSSPGVDQGLPNQHFPLNEAGLPAMDKTVRPAPAIARLGDSHYAEIVSSAEDAIISKDLDGVVQTWNAGATRLFGYTADEMVGHSIRRVIPRDLHHEEEAILQHIRSGRRIEHYETRRSRKSGEEFVASVTISPIKDGFGRVIGASKIARDVTESRQADQDRLRTEKLAATARIATVLAHQINNPLEALVNLIYVAQQRSSDELISVYLELAQQELRRITHLARYSMGALFAGEMPSVLYARELIEQILLIYETRLTGGQLEVSKDFRATRQIQVRAGEMLQVLSAVITNAIDAMPFGGRLELSSRDAERDGREGVEIVIRDTGVGIREEHAKRLFEPFFTTKGTLGAGMGLYTARQFVQNYTGTIAIESSTEPGHEGTAVLIFLPMSSLPQTS